LDAETQIRLEEMKLRGAQMAAEVDAAENELARQAQHQAVAQGQSHDVTMAAIGHEQGREMAEIGHGQALEQAEQTAALQPPPAVESES
jgi:predicted HD phosphohydrolase